MSSSLRRSQRTQSSSSQPSTSKRPARKPGESSLNSKHGKPKSKQIITSPDLRTRRESHTSDDSNLSPTRKRSNSNSTVVSHISEESEPQEYFKYTIQNIPTKFAPQKHLYTLLTTHLLVRDIEVLKANFNKSALLITRSELPPNFHSQLQRACSDASVTIGPINPRNRPQQNSKKSPYFSIVVRDVDISIEEMDIVNHATSVDLKIHKIWRIVSKKTNKPTPLVRVISSDPQTIDTLLNSGLNIFGRHHPCEPSHPPPPTPVQCPKCFTLGHTASECNKKPICPTCPNTHAPNKCPKTDPQCPFCHGNHPAWSRKCPEFEKLTVTPETPTIPTYIINPPAEFADPVDPLDDVPEPVEINVSTIHAKALIAYTTKLFFDLFPHEKSKTQSAIKNASQAIFKITPNSTTQDTASS
ncbi:hypothetical protein Zmor_016975 [Zophobas morio]|uniref:Gag-like protein n=1 Tax=Zophobas morio TaxID=2755281 RepID=A0AA38MBF7_9CUCU|nr:hypothetical protein Zmor_016975 [Zophobas morio]